MWEMNGLMRGIVAGSLGLSESSGKTSHTDLLIWGNNVVNTLSFSDVNCKSYHVT